MPQEMEQILEHGLSERKLREFEGKLVCSVSQLFYDLFSCVMVVPHRLFIPA